MEQNRYCFKVASFTDAWIETCPLTVKPNRDYVASFTDAWIETDPDHKKEKLQTSHLLQMRGLKPRIFDICYVTEGSHLLQMRGLKLSRRCRKRNVKCVASFTDAWIETAIISALLLAIMSHLLQMRGLKPPADVAGPIMGSRIFYRCVD